MSEILFFVFGELIGMVIRFVFVYHFNFRKMQEAYKEDYSSESSKNNFTTIIFVLLVILSLFFLSCGSITKTQNAHKEVQDSNKTDNVFFSDTFTAYMSNALKYSHLTQDIDIVDKLNTLDSANLNRIKKLNIYPKNSMNFINPYNDSLNVVFSFPKRYCLPNQSISAYVDNFSTAVHYIVIFKKEATLLDSMTISHETRPVPPIDCNEKHIDLPNAIKSTIY